MRSIAEPVLRAAAQTGRPAKASRTFRRYEVKGQRRGIVGPTCLKDAELMCSCAVEGAAAAAAAAAKTIAAAAAPLRLRTTRTKT